VYGNINGLKSITRKRIQNLYRRRVPPHEIVSPELARDLAHFSFDAGRQIGLLVGRDGSVEMVLVGGPRSLYIPDLPKARGGRWRLCGLRLVHTHLGREPLGQDDLMDLVFLRLDCIAAVRIDPHGGAALLDIAHIVPDREQQNGWEILPSLSCGHPNVDFLALVRSLEEELERNRPAISAIREQDRAILVSVTRADSETLKASLAELKELARAGGISVAETIVQKQRYVNSRSLLGKGKLSEIVVSAFRQGVDLLIFDQELNPSQVKAITDTTELRVIDRTQLILDIFAQRAQSREGKIQVEMAQLKYLLPRLEVKDDALSRLTGGIGARGPGETKLEINRRRIKDRISLLERQVRAVRKSRALRRVKRKRKEVPVISIVGYTNAGKSTLLNTLTHSRVRVEDKLFATLDPSSRRLRFPRDFEVIITDTVGFIRDLPKDLLEAFAATLEELYDADLLLHIVDISNPRFEEHISAVQEVLLKLDLQEKPTTLVFNKIDLVTPDHLKNLVKRHKAIPISAPSTKTLGPLILSLQDRMKVMMNGNQWTAKGGRDRDTP